LLETATDVAAGVGEFVERGQLPLTIAFAFRRCRRSVKVGATAFGFNPTFVSGLNKTNRRVIYAVNEVGDDSVLVPGTKTGYVYAISVDAAGTMTELNRIESGGVSPAHVSVSPDENFVTVSNYNGGSVSIYPLNANGSLQEASDFHQYTGGSQVVAGSQDAPHMHSMTWVGKGSSGVFGADLGSDRVAQFNLNKRTGKLVSNARQEFITRPPGSGPRSNSIQVFRVDEATGCSRTRTSRRSAARQWVCSSHATKPVRGEATMPW